MTIEEVDKLNIKNEDGEFTPKTIEKIVEEEIDGETVQTFDYEIVQSAEDYYKEWLNNKNNQPKKEPTENEVLISNIILENAQLKTGLQEQQELTANLLLQIDELKGGNANV